MSYVYYDNDDITHEKPLLVFKKNKSLYSSIQRYRYYITYLKYKNLSESLYGLKIQAIAENSICKRLGIKSCINMSKLKKFYSKILKITQKSRESDDELDDELDDDLLGDCYQYGRSSKHVIDLGDFGSCYDIGEELTTYVEGSYYDTDEVCTGDSFFWQGCDEYLKRLDKQQRKSIEESILEYFGWAESEGVYFGIEFLFIECPVQNGNLEDWFEFNLNSTSFPHSKIYKVKDGYILHYITIPNWTSDYHALAGNRLSMQNVMIELYERFGAEQGWWEHPNTKIS